MDLVDRNPTPPTPPKDDIGDRSSKASSSTKSIQNSPRKPITKAMAAKHLSTPPKPPKEGSKDRVPASQKSSSTSSQQAIRNAAQSPVSKPMPSNLPTPPQTPDPKRAGLSAHPKVQEQQLPSTPEEASIPHPDLPNQSTPPTTPPIPKAKDLTDHSLLNNPCLQCHTKNLQCSFHTRRYHGEKDGKTCCVRCAGNGVDYCILRREMRLNEVVNKTGFVQYVGEGYFADDMGKEELFEMVKELRDPGIGAWAWALPRAPRGRVEAMKARWGMTTEVTEEQDFDEVEDGASSGGDSQFEGESLGEF